MEPETTIRDAVVVVLRRGDRVLVIRRGPAALLPGFWAPLSGRVEPGETHEDAVVREVQEEVGLTASPVAKVWECLTDDGTFRLHWWLADAEPGDLRPDPGEVGEARWIVPGRFAELEPTFAGDREFFTRVLPTLTAGPQPPPLPPSLPRPLDDGAAAHLLGKPLPDISLRSTHATEVNLATSGDALVLYVFPKMAPPDDADPAGWNQIPGARGCTQQSCAFRDRERKFAASGYAVAGLSAQTPEEQAEAAQRLHLSFPLLADPDRRVGNGLALPTFSVGDTTFYKRLTLVAREGRIVKVFYPVFPPDENPQDVLDWIHTQGAHRSSAPDDTT